MAKKIMNDNSRPTASEYLTQMHDLQNQVTKLDLVVTTRLYTLAIQYPEAPIETVFDTVMKAKTLIPINRSKSAINIIPFETRINYIHSIEQWLANQQQYIQTKMFEL